MSGNKGLLHSVIGFSFVLLLCLCMGAPAPAAVHQCTVSGSYWILLDSNGTPGPQEPPHATEVEIATSLASEDPEFDFGCDAYFTMQYNDTTGQLEIVGHGIFPPIFWSWDSFLYTIGPPGSTVVLQELSDHNHMNPNRLLWAMVSKINGATGFNKLNMVIADPSAGDPASAAAALTDANGDGIYDSVLGDVNFYLGPPIHFDSPLSFTSANGNQYWHLPSNIPIGVGTTIPGPKFRRCVPGNIFQERDSIFDIYVPVANNSMWLTCGGTTWGFVTRIAPSGGGVVARPTVSPVPTLNEWGSLLIILLLLIGGIWGMRKTGFGKSISLD